jgi:hypothetical protein
MAFKTFAPGVLTSSDVNTFLMRQAVIACTSSTRPGSPNEGMTIYETDTDSYKLYDGSNWIDAGRAVSVISTYTPTLSGTGWTFNNPTITGRFTRLGRWVFLGVRIVWAGGTTAGANDLEISLPVSASTGDRQMFYGSGVMIDVSTGSSFMLQTSPSDTTADNFRPFGFSKDSGSNNLIRSSINSTSIGFGLACPRDSTDVWRMTYIYEGV